MRKVRLNPDELRVESFDTVAVEKHRGTVGAREQEWTGPDGYTCQAVMTCYQGGSCPAFSCVSQCDRNCFEDWSEGCEFETGSVTCWSCTCGQTCSCECPETFNGPTCSCNNCG